MNKYVVNQCRSIHHFRCFILFTKDSMIFMPFYLLNTIHVTIIRQTSHKYYGTIKTMTDVATQVEIQKMKYTIQTCIRNNQFFLSLTHSSYPSEPLCIKIYFAFASSILLLWLNAIYSMHLMSGIPRQQRPAIMFSPSESNIGMRRNAKAQTKAQLLLTPIFYLSFNTVLFSLTFVSSDLIAFVTSLRNDFNFVYIDDLIVKLILYIIYAIQTPYQQSRIAGQLPLSEIYLNIQKFQLQFQTQMGGSSNKIKIAIIDQNERQEDFEAMKNESLLKITYYKSLQQFLQNQSLKKLSYIVIREKQKNQSEQDKEGNSITAKKMDNLQQLTSQFRLQVREKNITVREKLIAYIRKFSLQKLVIYLYIKNALNYKVPDYEAPYLTLIADSLQTIMDHVKTQPKREEPAIFKFKRLVKDLYRRSTVRIFEIKAADQKQRKDSDDSEAEWKQLMSKYKITVDFSYDTGSFEQSLISNYSDYIIVNSPQLLTYMLDAKKQFQFDSKIIYFGNEEEVQHKKSSIWMISKGRSSVYKTIVVETIKKCSDLITDKSSARPKLTIIFTTNHYTREQKDLVKAKAVQCLKKATKEQDKRWIDEMQILVTSNYDRLKDQLKNFVYTYLITFDCTVSQSQDLKAWLKKNNFGNRIYLYNLELKSGKQSKNSQEKESRMNKISKDVETMVTKAAFKIKFEIGPLQSIALFQMGDKQYRYFSSKLGLITTKIDEQLWRADYCKKNRIKIIDNYYIVCNVSGYLRKLKGLIAEEAQQANSYFKDLRVIVYDKKQALQQHWDELKNASSIAFVHYNFSRIQDFLDIVFVPNLKLTIFVKKSLPQYMEAVKGVEESKSRHLKLNGITVSKNNLLKEVFSQEVLTSSHFDLNFRHFSITNRNLQESIDSLYNFVAKFANLWRVGYDIIKAKQDKGQVIDTLRTDIKACLYKCKSYSLLEVSDDEFDYFYIKRLDICQTFLDLQIAVIYMTTLPHGFNKILEQIFSRPKQNCMIPKVFAAFIVILLTAFCSVQDEVMSNTNLVVYMDDQDLASKIGSLNIGDILFNTSFIPSEKNESIDENESNHCLFIQFQSIPMLSESFIKNYLYIQRFSFYKESSEYLIAPYTRFVLKNKVLTSNGKYHIFLHAVNDQMKGFPQNVFKANSIDDKELFNTIKEEIYSIHNDDANLSKMTHDVKSLYKKSEIISLYQQKKQMIKSINDSLQYKNFMNAMNKERYLSALNHLNIKQKQQKMTTQLQAHYFKAMLGVERSLIYFKINQFDQAIKVLQKVQKFLENQQQNWVKRNIRTFKESMIDLSTKRHKLFNRAPKVKRWKIYTDREANNPQKTSFLPVVVMKQQQFQWSVNYLPKKQQFYIANSKDSQTAILPYKVKQNYGDLVASFTNQMVYEKANLTQLVEQQRKLGDYFKYKIDKKITKFSYQITQGIYVKNYASSPAKIKSYTEQSDLNENHNKLQQVKKEKDKAKELKIEKKPIELQAPKNIFEEFQKEEQEQPQQSKSMAKLTPIKNFNNFEKLLGVTQAVAWQSFYIGDKFVLTKKGKHIKGKMLNKIQ